MNDQLEWLQGYLSANADGWWEHDYGIAIESTDNPGWAVKIDLKGDGFLPVLPPVQIRRSETDWLTLKMLDGAFVGSCSPTNLAELLSLIRETLDGGA